MSINGLMHRNFCSDSFMLASLIFHGFFVSVPLTRSLAYSVMYERQTFIRTWAIKFCFMWMMLLTEKKKASFNLIYFSLSLSPFLLPVFMSDKHTTRFYIRKQSNCSLCDVMFPSCPHCDSRLSSFQLSSKFVIEYAFQSRSKTFHCYSKPNFMINFMLNLSETTWVLFLLSLFFVLPS